MRRLLWITTMGLAGLGLYEAISARNGGLLVFAVVCGFCAPFSLDNDRLRVWAMGAFMALQIAQLRTFSDALLWAGASALGVVLCGVGLLHLLNRYGSSEP